MLRTKEISNTDDLIDSRDVVKRIEELESEREDWQTDNELEDYPGFEMSEEGTKWFEWDESSEGLELESLLALQEELEDYAPDWNHGTTLIRDSYFTEYCKDLVNDIGDLPRDLPSYIESNINWDGVAEDLKVDYTSGEFDGVEYWVR